MDLGTVSLTTEGTFDGTPVTGLGKVNGLSLQVALTRTSGGTTVKVFIQSSIDGGASWYDIACFAFTTSSAVKRASVINGAGANPAAVADGTLSDDTRYDGFIGDRIRHKTIVSGNYGAGSKAVVSYFPH